MDYLGDYFYGTEILNLPRPGVEYLPGDTITNEPSFQLHPEQELSSSDVKYWFRWVTGHQVMLTLWHLLVVEFRKEETELTLEKLETATQILKSCSIIFEYTGSCPNEFYHQKVRTFMALFHRGFSGMWAADYRPIPRLIRQISKAAYPSDLKVKQQAFLNTYYASQKAHISVAEKLVPENVSLLKKAKKGGVDLNKIKKEHFMIFDAFFLINRTPVSHKNLIFDLKKRLTVICQDLKNISLSGTLSSQEAISILQKTIAVIKTENPINL